MKLRWIVLPVITTGLLVSFARAQDGRPGDDGRMDKLRQIEKERAELQKALERLEQAERELRGAMNAPGPRGEPGRVMAPPIREERREGPVVRPPEEKPAARITEDQLRERRLRELAEQSAQLRKEVEARPLGKPAPSKEKGDDEGVRIMINGKEVKLGAGSFMVDGARNPAERGGEGREREGADRPRMELRPFGRPGSDRDAAVERKDEIKVFVNGKEVKLGEGREGKFTWEGAVARPGQPMPGANPWTPQGRFGPGQAMTGGPNPWTQGRFGAGPTSGAQGRPGMMMREREDGDRGERGRPEGGEMRRLTNPFQGGPGAFGRPTPGAPMAQPQAPGRVPPVMAGAPAQMKPVQAAPAQQIHQMTDTLHALQGLCFDTDTAALAAIAAIKEGTKDRPVATIRVLESSLKDVQKQGLRNAIHLTLKDIYKAQGNEEMALNHLRAILVECDKAGAMHRGDGREGPRREMKDGKKDKDEDDDD